MRLFLALPLCLFASACSDDVRPPITTSTKNPGGSTGIGPNDGGAPAEGEDGGTRAACTKPGIAGEIYALSARNLADTEDVPLCAFRGKVMLIFNGASFDTNTPQYRPLQGLYAQYEPLGFVVLGFPCNQFGASEPGSGKEIADFCAKEYKITFPLFQKTDVFGPKAHPVFQWIKAQKGGEGDISWNFEKFLVGRDGKLRQRFAPVVQPDAPEVLTEIQLALSE